MRYPTRAFQSDTTVVSNDRRHPHHVSQTKAAPANPSGRLSPTLLTKPPTYQFLGSGDTRCSFRCEDWPDFIGELQRPGPCVRRFVSPIAPRRLIVIARRELRFNALWRVLRSGIRREPMWLRTRRLCMGIAIVYLKE